MDQPEVHWNSQLEKIISDEGERALCYSWLHDKSEERYTRFNNCITLPTIVGSTVAGTAAIGSKTLFGDSWYGNLGIGILSLGVAVFNTIATHFGWSSRADAHRVARIDYSKIHRFIMIELSLPREERTDASSMLKMVREQLDNLLATSPQIANEIIVKFNNKFEGTTDNISKPGITNGLDPINVYKAGTSPDQTPRHPSTSRLLAQASAKLVLATIPEVNISGQSSAFTPQSIPNSVVSGKVSPVKDSVFEGEDVVVNISGTSKEE
jgi:hypothetical protein